MVIGTSFFNEKLKINSEKIKNKRTPFRDFYCDFTFNLILLRFLHGKIQKPIQAKTNKGCKPFLLLTFV